jgi:hypothetical protein
MMIRVVLSPYRTGCVKSKRIEKLYETSKLERR